MASRLQIKNMALAELPDAPIASENEASLQARETNRFYEPCLKELLEAHEWGFANRRVALASIVNERDREWGYAYQLPSDLGTPIGIVPDWTSIISGVTPGLSANSITSLYGDCPQILNSEYLKDYVIEGETLYTNLENVILEYGLSSVNENVMSALFQRALVLELASRIAMPLGKSRELKGDLIQAAEVAKARAMADNDNRYPRRHSEGYVSEVERARMGW